MNRYDRQEYKDVSLEEIDYDRFDICQLKFDGIWCGCDVSQDRTLEYYSRHGELKRRHNTKSQIEPGLYIGEFMYGSEWAKENNREGKIYVFDMIEHRSVGLRNLPYVDRYVKLYELFKSGMMPDNFELVQNYHSAQAGLIWDSAVETGLYEGMVFRNSRDIWDTVIYRAKYSFELDLYIEGFEPSEKVEGAVGAIVANERPTFTGAQHVIGNGLTLRQRKDMHENPHQYIGRCFTVTAKKQFKSGQLRHSSFVRWHPDKK